MKQPLRRIRWTLVALIAGLSMTTPGAFALPFQQLIVFGDSLSDVGNDFIATKGLIPPPIAYGNGRFTDGTDSVPSTSLLGLWHEQLSTKLGLPVATPSLGGGTDFAFGGAETGISSTFGAFTIPGMATQLHFFLTGKTSVPSNALYVFWGGANNLFDAGSPSAINAAASQAITDISTEIGTLASLGGKYFLWVDLPPLDKTPSGRTSPFSSALQAASVSFDSQFVVAVPGLEAKFPGITIAPVDVYSLYTSIISSPSTFGLTDVTDPAQGNVTANPDKFLFWDGQHPTTAGHALIADLAAQDLLNTFGTGVPEPANLLPVLVGLAVVALTIGRRRSGTRASTIE